MTQRVVDFINHNYGNVKDNGIIKQYLFTEESTIKDVEDFFNYYYPDVNWKDIVYEKNI